MAKYKKMVFKTVEEWLEARKSRIGGSEVSSIVYLNPYRSKYDLYRLKMGLVEPEPENEAMRFGHYFEDAVAKALEGEYGYQIVKNTAGNVIYLSEDYPFAEASPDRLAYLPCSRKTEENKCIVEIKNTEVFYDEDTLPKSWLCQVQWYMGITGIHKAVIAWCRGRRLGYKELAFDEEFFNFLATEAAQFVEDMKNGVEPPAVTASDIAAKYPTHTEAKYNEATEDLALACAEYKDLSADIKKLEAKQTEIANAIKIAIADAEGLSYAGLTLATYKNAKSSEKFDAKAFCEAEPEMAKKYMKVIAGARRLTVK